MKTHTIAVVAATAASAVAAQPHHHQHRHFHPLRRDATVTDWAPAATATVFEFEGHTIGLDEVCSGLAGNEMMWSDHFAPSWLCSPTSSSATPTSTTTPATTTEQAASTTTSTGEAGEFYQPSQWSDINSLPSSASVDSSSTSGWSSSAPAEATSGSTTSVAKGLGSTFPDGEIPCSQFPSEYGAVPIDYLNLAGWTGLQSPGSSSIAGAIDNIVTGVAGSTCSEGMYCSYACPAGWQKAQWPSTQGATGQSVGGLHCSGGMLRLTNSALSSSLCMEGVGGVTAQNNAGSVVSICRTDYPGTESETVPTVLQAGDNQPLTVPDAANYYTWEGKSTSAQYYLNPPGYGASDACQWGSPGSPLGNYAPINFGVGAKDGTTWLSIMANTPTTDATYPGTVEIQGSNLAGTCKYENGQFCSASGCNSAGCTVSSPPPHSSLLNVADINSRSPFPREARQYMSFHSDRLITTRISHILSRRFCNVQPFFIA